MIKEAGIEVCSGGILGMGESLEQRAEFAADLQELQPEEVPMNFLDPRPGTPFADYEVMEAADALRAIGAFPFGAAENDSAIRWWTRVDLG